MPIGFAVIKRRAHPVNPKATLYIIAEFITFERMRGASLFSL